MRPTLATISAVLLPYVIFSSACSSGRTVVPAATAGIDFAALLKSRVSVQIRPPVGPPFALYRISDGDVNSDEYRLEVIWLEFPASKARTAVRQIDSAGSADELYAQLSGRRDLALLNGGYWETREETKNGKKEAVSYPEGLVRANGRDVAKLKPEMGGGVAFQQGPIFTIVPTAAFAELSDQVSDALQCKPMLVENRQSGMKSDDHRRDDRLAIANDSDGGIIVALATQPQGALTLVEFANFLIIPKNAGGPGAVNALNLDGGPGAHIYIPALNMHLGRHGFSQINNVIHIQR